jgi:allantoinase
MPRRIFTSDHVLLPGASDPSPATVIVDVASGKITSVEHGKKLQSDFADADVDEADFIDAGDLWILPGLVEYVHLPQS